MSAHDVNETEATTDEVPPAEAPHAEKPRASVRDTLRKMSRPRMTNIDFKYDADEEDEEEEEEGEDLALKEKPRPPWLAPLNTPTFAIPQVPDLMRIFDLYKPTADTCRKLKSEIGRKVFSEAFIEDLQLGTLGDLAVHSMAKAYGDIPLPDFISQDPAKMRVHYSSLDVELPLERCYHIESPIYWRRVVLAKDDNTAMVLKTENEFNWRSHGISLKWVELVEECPAEHWPEEDMQRIALKIKPFVYAMKITQLKALQEYSFEKYFESDNEDGDSDLNIWNISTSTISAFSTSIESELSVEEEVEEEGEEGEEEEESTIESIVLVERADKKAEDVITKAAQKDAQRRKHQAKRDRIQLRKDKRMKQAIYYQEQEELLAQPKKKKKNKAIKTKGVFDIPISDDEEALKDFFELDKKDNRDIERVLRRCKRFNYEPEFCHHVDLKILRFFDNLETFHLEFQAPEDGNFHTRHYNCSYVDIENLAKALECLYNLKTFRLRNSRLDSRKINELIPVLRTLPKLETIDFGNDQLCDDCGNALYRLFRQSNQQRLFLELEGNYFGNKVLHKLADGIRYYRGNIEYLGLARNPIDKDGFEALVLILIKTGMVSNLCLTGIQISQEGIVDVIANLLLGEHKNLRNMSLGGIPFTFQSGVRLIKALENNMTILEMDVRGCGLELGMESDIATLLKRNNYLVDNPYIGDETKTEEEIREHVNRIKNPILLGVLERIEKRRECERNRPTMFIKEEKVEGRKYTLYKPEEVDSETSLERLIKRLQKATDPERHPFFAESQNIISPDLSQSSESEDVFVFDANNFTKEQLLKHIGEPGPPPRYFYFQQQRRLGAMEDPLKHYFHRP